MITNATQLHQARAARASLEDALRALRARVESQNPALFQAMAENYVAGIEKIQRDIDEYVGVAFAAEYAAPLWIRLSGNRLVHGEVSSRLLAKWLQVTGRTVHNVAYYLQHGLTRIPKKTAESFMNLTDLSVEAVLPGSIQIGLKPRRPDREPDLLSEFQSPTPELVEQALAKIIALAEWGSSEPTGMGVESFVDRDEASFVAMQVAQMAPTERSPVETVTFSGALVAPNRPLVLDTEARNRLLGLASLLSTTTVESAEGHIREIDLDAERITLRERGAGYTDLKCYIPSDLMDLAESLLNRYVQVEGTISSATPDTMIVRTLRRANPPERRM